MVEDDRLNVKHIADIVGQWGKWQRHLFSYCFILRAATAINNMGYSFHAYHMDFWCNDVPVHYQNKTSEMKCHKFMNPNESCTHWNYDRNEFKRSIISEFDLVCDRTNLASISQSIFMLGYFVSGLIFSHYSDKYGRRPLVWISLTIELLSLISCSFSVNITHYIISRFFLGIGSSGEWMAISTILIECSGARHRSDVYTISNVGWVLGYVLIPGLAFWLKDFRYMQLCSVALIIVMMIWFYIFYESPRWQLTNGQIDRAEVTLRKALKENGKSDENFDEQLVQLTGHLQNSNEKIKRRTNILDLFKTPKLRKYTLIIWYSYIVNALVYYGFSFNMSDFGGNFYITFLLAGFVELPSSLTVALALKYIGRRKLFSGFLMTAALSCIAVIPSINPTLKVFFALLGKFSITSSFTVMGVHGPEVFPTVLRNTGFGAASAVGRIGSIAAPFMKNLAANTSLALVMVFYAILAGLASLLVLLLPETKGREIPDTLEEAENAGNNC